MSMKKRKKGKIVVNMPYNNSSNLTEKEFFKLVARFVDGTPNEKTIKKYWEAIMEAITRQVFLQGKCRIPRLGTITTKTVGESYQVHKDKNGETTTYVVPERDIPIFTPDDDFINDINMKGVTKKYRKRSKKGTLSMRDYQRQIRAEELNVFGSLSKERLEESKTNFLEKLSNIKQEHEKELKKSESGE